MTKTPTIAGAAFFLFCDLCAALPRARQLPRASRAVVPRDLDARGLPLERGDGRRAGDVVRSPALLEERLGVGARLLHRGEVELLRAVGAVCEQEHLAVGADLHEPAGHGEVG